jgi:phosphohistidine phosphatase
MMHLYFVRHGLATWASWPGEDAERPLTPDGARLVSAAGAGLARRLSSENILPERVLHSPLTRARQTAEILAEKLALDGRLREHRLLSPGFDLMAFKTVIREQAAGQTLVLVGHNPDFNDVVTRLTGHNVRFREGTVACLKLEAPEAATLVWTASAEELAADK